MIGSFPSIDHLLIVGCFESTLISVLLFLNILESSTMWKIVVIALLSVLLPLPDQDFDDRKARVAEAQIAGVPSTDWCKFSHNNDIYIILMGFLYMFE